MYDDLDRPPLREAALRGLVRSDGLWTGIRVVAETASTNADVAAAAVAGAAEGLVLVAERQAAGRGRLGRSWNAPLGAGLTFSVLLRPTAAPARFGWLPLLAGVAVCQALSARAGLSASLKWPNDVLVDDDVGPERKIAGILAQVAGGAVVLGVGLNIAARLDELPPGVAATSLALAGATTTDRTVVLRAVLRALERIYDEWRADPHPVAAAYRERCVTLGREVRLEGPGGGRVEGKAVRIDDDGRLVVLAEGIERAYGAGDVVHLRPGGS